MSRPRLEVADVMRTYAGAVLDRYGATLTPEQRRVLHDLPRCRTAEMGGHVEACDRCGHRRIAYNSCRNRHCPNEVPGHRGGRVGLGPRRRALARAVLCAPECYVESVPQVLARSRPSLNKLGIVFHDEPPR